jgi:hypothetical protein
MVQRGSITAMGYKLLGYVVWRGGKWYLRRRYGQAPRKLLAGGIVALVVAGALVAQRQSGGTAGE